MSGSGNTAKDLASEGEISEPSMEEILASIKQIIADDEAVQDDGLTERERYTHPSDASNSNRAEENTKSVAETTIDMEDVLADSASTEGPELAPEPVVPAPRPTTLEQRLEEYRQRDRLRMEKLAEQSGIGPAAQSTVPPVRSPTRRIDGSPAGSGSSVQVAAEYVAKELDVTSVVESLARDVFAQHKTEIEAKLMEAMAPVVRKWLGDNLPTLVERLVRQEIEQVSRQN